MQRLIIGLFFVFSGLLARCQVADTVRTYLHAMPVDRWEITLRNNNNFKFSSYTTVTKEGINATGTYSVQRNAVRFLCDTPLQRSANWRGNLLRYFTNIPFIISGDSLGWQAPFLLPRRSERCKSKRQRNFLPGSYSQSDGANSDVIDLKPDGAYTYSSNHCTISFKQKGKWKQSAGTVILFTGEFTDLLQELTDHQTFQIEDGYLIGKKITLSDSMGKAVVNEKYTYLLKKNSK